MAITRIGNPAIADVRGVNFRNIIINGDMSISQRSTSASSITSSGYHALDRHRLAISSLGTWTISQSTDVPTGQGFGKSMKFDCTTADASPSAGDVMWVQHRIEGQNLQYLKKGTSSAEKTTLSFWVKSNKTGTYIAELEDTDNSRHIAKSYTISSSDTWEKKTITFDGDTTGTLTNDNNTSLELHLYLGAGTNYTSGTLATSWASNTDANRAVGQVNLADSTSNEWYVTGIQLETGSQASDFEFLPHDVNLRRCQRYYFLKANYRDGAEDDIIGPGLYYSSSIFKAIVQFPITMRAVPSLDQTSGTDYYQIRRNGGLDNVDDFNIQDEGKTGIVLDNSSDASGTAGHAAWVRTNNASASIAFDAEL
jgi:hypothetical protein